MKKIPFSQEFKVAKGLADAAFIPAHTQDVELPFLVHNAQAASFYKYFYLTNEMRGKRLFLQFDGGIRFVQVYLNGNLISSHTSAFAGFVVDISKQVLQDGRNLLCVHTSNATEQMPVGLHRNMWLLVGSSVMISPFGMRISTPEAFTDRAQIVVETELCNSGEKIKSVIVRTTIFNSKGRKVAAKKKRVRIKAASYSVTAINIRLKKAQLWSPESPFVYRAVTEVFEDNLEKIKSGEAHAFDIIESRFGIKSAEFVMGQGFVLNGARMKLKGGCIPHHNGLLGMCTNPDAEGRKVRLLKEAGLNAVSVKGSPSPALVEACDLEGMMLLPQIFCAWSEPKRELDAHLHFEQDWSSIIDSTIRPYLNCPSIVAWGIGDNPREKNEPKGAQIVKKLTNYVHTIDPHRAVMVSAGEVLPDYDALDNLVDERSFKDDESQRMLKVLELAKDGNFFAHKTAEFFAPVDVAGYVNLSSRYAADSAAYPDRLFLGMDTTENAGEVWSEVNKLDNVIGDFCAHAIASPQSPSQGEIDITGRRRAASYHRAVAMGDKGAKIAAIDPDSGEAVEMWNFPRHLGQKVEVEVYTHGDVVAIYQNGTPVGRRLAGKANGYKAAFEVEYQSGRLEAVCFLKGEELSRVMLETVGSPKSMRISIAKKRVAGLKGALLYADIEILDAEGRVVPFADREVTTEVRGTGRLLALGSSKGVCDEGENTVKVSEGRAQAIIELDGNAGKVEIICTCPGLKRTAFSVRTV